VKELDARYLASRESAELRAETLQMGYSLRKLILDLALPIAVDAAAADLSHGVERLVAPLGHCGRRGAGRLALELGREPGDGGLEDGATGPGRRSAHPA
jgi:urease accessory protein